MVHLKLRAEGWRRGNWRQTVSELDERPKRQIEMVALQHVHVVMNKFYLPLLQP